MEKNEKETNTLSKDVENVEDIVQSTNHIAFDLEQILGLLCGVKDDGSEKALCEKTTSVIPRLHTASIELRDNIDYIRKMVGDVRVKIGYFEKVEKAEK